MVKFENKCRNQSINLQFQNEDNCCLDKLYLAYKNNIFGVDLEHKRIAVNNKGLHLKICKLIHFCILIKWCCLGLDQLLANFAKVDHLKKKIAFEIICAKFCNITQCDKFCNIVKTSAIFYEINVFFFINERRMPKSLS